MTVRDEKRDILEADLASLKVINSFLIMKVIYAQCALKYLNIFRCGSLLLSVFSTSHSVFLKHTTFTYSTAEEEICI